MLVCMQFDRLYLGQAVPLAMVGVYGIARTLCEMPVALALRLSHSLVFPAISAGSGKPRHELRASLGSVRLHLVTAGAVLMAFGMAFSDLFVRLIYDSRYHEAGTMMSLLLLGSWLSILTHINEYALMGLGRPAYAVTGNIAKALYLVVALPLALSRGGIMLAIAALAVSDLPRMVPLGIGLVRERIGFFRQDILATALVAGCAFVLLGVRYWAGFGLPWDGVLR